MHASGLLHVYMLNVEFLQLCCYTNCILHLLALCKYCDITWKKEKINCIIMLSSSNICLCTFACICLCVNWLPQQVLLMFCVALTEDVTMVICPGIGNHSEKHYIRTFVDYSQKQGYRCAVLNHLGALPNIELTSPRMFTYGTRRVQIVFIQETSCF